MIAHLNEQLNTITLILTNNSQPKKTIKCNRNDILENILKDFSLQIGFDFNSLFFYIVGKK